MKYMILSYGSQRDYDGMAGQATGDDAWTPEEFAGMVEFMRKFNAELEASGELVDTRGLAAPVHTRRVSGSTRAGVPVAVTDGPYAETQEVLAGYWIVECDSFDRATEIALRLAECPAPRAVAARAFADVRPIDQGADEIQS
ncbi:YciI family protein [Nocardia yamanashiensis]|uniref:YciI family protein n=1 Tax=Nocardia yamanashiensis TaxID=209247 RepID=UPI001E38757A|nr:YciI family protein [Nocardia yamanashiensis]UGT43435.1 YciI family protein [Nocardia yamanashiensis]